MTAEEARDFIDCMTFEDCTVMFRGQLFWCYGLTWSKDTSEYTIAVDEDDPVTHERIRAIFEWTSNSRDDCMKHFLEDKYWDGKSFYEVAQDLEWIDL